MGPQKCKKTKIAFFELARYHSKVFNYNEIKSFRTDKYKFPDFIILKLDKVYTRRESDKVTVYQQDDKNRIYKDYQGNSLINLTY